MEIKCPDCGSDEVIHAGSGHFVCCSCDHEWKAASEERTHHHVESECGHFCNFHKAFECEMIVGDPNCNFSCGDDMGEMEDHLFAKGIEEYNEYYTAGFKARINGKNKGHHLMLLEDIMHRWMDDC